MPLSTFASQNPERRFLTDAEGSLDLRLQRARAERRKWIVQCAEPCID
jgi:hypothetical protein